MRALLTTLAFSFAATATAMAPAAAAGDFPVKPITLVVPYTPGGSTDATARVVAEQLSRRLGQQVVVENRAGAAGNIGANIVAQAAADGYTLLMAPSGLIANVALYKSLPYDLIKDFDPISRIALIPNVLVVNPQAKANTFQDFIALAKSSKTPLTYGSAGNGTGQHLAGALFANKVGVDMTHVPYKGGAPSLTDLMGGRIDAVFAPLVEVLPFIQADKLKALAVTTTTRSFALPDVPAIGETFPGFEITLWNGILAPRGTPPERIAILNKGIQDVLAQSDVQQILRTQGSTPSGNTPAEFRQLLAAEVVKWAGIVKMSGAEMQ